MVAERQSVPWSDAALSAQLPTMRSSGEGQHLEFKEQWPTNGRDLAKEIAAFATASGGTILVGVEDDGSLVGIPDGEQSTIRDELSQRLAGICTSTVTPSITPLIKWAIEGGRVVLAIIVPEGEEPVYYASNVPYVRHLNTARPAEPHEVVSLVLAHYGHTRDEQAPEWASDLARALLPVIVLGSEIEERMVDPWLSEVIAQFKESASSLRQLLAGDALPEQHRPAVKSLVAICDSVTNVRLGFGFGADFTKSVRGAVECADGLWERAIEPFQRDPRLVEPARREIAKALNTLDDLLERADDLLFGGGGDEFASGVSSVGQLLFRVALVNLRAILPEAATELIHIGMRLHTTETVRLYMDGGQSQDALKARVAELRGELGEVSARLPSSD